MKKSRIAKLALMGASITALAATLTTSTYAWYVSNKTATMSDGEGTTGTAGSDGSILVSWTGGENKWFKNVNFDDEDAVTTVNDLSPIHYDGGWFELADDGTKGSASTAYITFTIKVKSGKAVTEVTPSITFSNWSGSTTQVAYVDDGLPTGKSAGQSFSVSAAKAVYVQQMDGSTATYCQADSTPVAGADAHAYWEAVTGETITWGDTAPTGTLGTFSLTANTPKTLTYTIYLEGADTDCFNSCAGYTFDFDLEFTITQA